MKKTLRRVTITDVARECGVSTQTVSRAYSQKGYIKKETKEKIFKVAKEMNYVPNSLARSIRIGKSKKIAVVFDTLKNLYFSFMVDYINFAVKKYGYSIDVMFVEEHILTKNIYKDIISKGDDGVISLLEVKDDVGDLVKKYKIPIIIAGRSTDLDNISYISANDYLGGSLAAMKLLETPLKNYIYLTEVPGMKCSDLRFNGFFDTLKAHNKEAIQVYCYENVNEKLAELSKNNYEFEGIFCFNDMLAYKAKTFLDENNIRFEKIIGYDGLSTDLPFLSSIPSIGIDKKIFAKKLVDTIMDMINGSNEKIIHEEIEPVVY